MKLSIINQNIFYGVAKQAENIFNLYFLLYLNWEQRNLLLTNLKLRF